MDKIKLHKGDVIDQYDPSDSDDEYTEREKILVKELRSNKKFTHQDSEEEILPFDDDNEDEDEDDENYQDEDDDDDFNKYEASSDIEDNSQYDDNIPDVRAWGKKRSDFYSTDFIDPDYSSYTTREEQQAEIEEQEAKTIQKRLAKELSENDFKIDTFYRQPSVITGSQITPADQHKSIGFDDNIEKTYLKSDLSRMSKEEKLQLFRKESPEFEGLCADFEKSITECQEIFQPILEYFKQHNLRIENYPILEFVQTRNYLIANYCKNIAFYLVLKAKRVSLKNHPLIKRLVQMKQLLGQLDDKYESIIKSKLMNFLNDLRSGKEIQIREDIGRVGNVTKKKLNILKAYAKAVEKPSKSINNVENTKNKVTFNVATDSESDDDDSNIDKDETMVNITDERNGQSGADNERRQITYEIAKNKGLTPYRKKELRNPRVKHRNKYRRALIRRKGAVRTVRKEIKRYAGELSGIKSTIKKGIKIK